MHFFSFAEMYFKPVIQSSFNAMHLILKEKKTPSEFARASLSFATELFEKLMSGDGFINYSYVLR